MGTVEFRGQDLRDQFDEQVKRAEQAEAILARVRVLPDQWRANCTKVSSPTGPLHAAGMINSGKGCANALDAALRGPEAAGPQEVEAQAILEAISKVLNGEAVDDFMGSFPIVRQVEDLVSEQLRSSITDLRYELLSMKHDDGQELIKLDIVIDDLTKLLGLGGTPLRSSSYRTTGKRNAKNNDLSG